jgi:hypothetical protein
MDKFLFENELHKEKSDENKKRIKKNTENFLKTNDLFKNITGIAIEISNICNYSCFHLECPASTINDKCIMPSEKVYKILNELSAIKYTGRIYFYIYNEPLIDPRLFMFIDYAKKNITGCEIVLNTNGFYLTQDLLYELKHIGVDCLWATAYGKSEWERLTNLDAPIAYRVRYGELDDRMKWDGLKDNNSNVPCNTFISLVNIFVNGDIGLCCYEYKHSYNLGNVFLNSIEYCLNSSIIIDIQKNLLNGLRILKICKKCKTYVDI